MKKKFSEYIGCHGSVALASSTAGKLLVPKAFGKTATTNEFIRHAGYFDYRQRIKHSAVSAEKYARRKPHKHQAEMALIEKGFKLLNDVKNVLDAPCGVGRATIWLAQRGYQATGIDLGKAAIRATREEIRKQGLPATALIDNIERMSFADQSFDVTLCFRLFHHFPNQTIRGNIVRELCRVSKRYILISYLTPWSPTSMGRMARNKLFGTPIKQHATSLKEVTGYFKGHGFKLVTDIPQKAFIHSLHLAVFERT